MQCTLKVPGSTSRCSPHRVRYGLNVFLHSHQLELFQLLGSALGKHKLLGGRVAQFVHKLAPMDDFVSLSSPQHPSCNAIAVRGRPCAKTTLPCLAWHLVESSRLAAIGGLVPVFEK